MLLADSLVPRCRSSGKMSAYKEMLDYFIRNEAKPSRLRGAAPANPPEGILTCGCSSFPRGQTKSLLVPKANLCITRLSLFLTRNPSYHPIVASLDVNFCKAF